MIFCMPKEAKIHMINSKIKIEPRVIQHLGQDLITSPEVAVTELLKNSIDAGSEKINDMYTIDVNLKSIGEA